MSDFARLYQDNYDAVYKACLSEFGRAGFIPEAGLEAFAEEITQEAFARAFAKRWQLRDKTKFLPWVIRIAIRYGRVTARLDRVRYNELPDDDISKYPHIASRPPAPLPEGESFVSRWLKTQKDTDCQLFVMRYYYKMPMREISAATRKPLGTVKRRLAHLKARLKEDLLAEDEV